MNEQTNPLFLGRAAVVLIAFVTGLSSLAQKAEDLQYRILFAAPMTQAQTKFVFEGLHSQDPNVVVSIEQPRHMALARTHAYLDRDILQTSVDPSGLVITEMSLVGGMLSSVKSTVTDVSGDGLPVFVSTGDPARDNERYELAKRAWIAGHPGAYEQLIAPLPER